MARDFQTIRDDLNRNTVEFLFIDTETALTLAKIAATEKPGSDRRERNQRNARTAYDTVRRMRVTVDVSLEQKAELDRRLGELRNLLQSMGEEFPE